MKPKLESQYMKLNNKRQQKNKTFSNKISPVPAFALNPVKYILEMPLGYYNHLKHMLNVAHRLEYIGFAQATIGQDSGKYHINYTHRILKEFEELGLIESEYHHRHPKIYRISTWFLIPAVRLMLMRLLPALALCIYSQCVPRKSLSNFSYNLESVSLSRDVTKSTVQIESSENGSLWRESDAYESEYDEEGEEMNNLSVEEIERREVKSLKLTRAGKLKLFGTFPEEAVYAADETFDASKAPGSPFNAFVNQCKFYCKDKGLQIAWSRGFELVKDEPNGPFVEQTNRTSSTSSSYSTNQRFAGGNQIRPGFQKQGERNLSASQQTADSLTRRLAKSASKFPTVMREFYGVSTDTTQQEKTQPTSNLSFAPSLDCGYP